MTKFRGPLKVGTHSIEQGENEYFVVEASGTTRVHGPLIVGATAGGGLTKILQQATLLAQNSAGAPLQFVLPSGANLVDILVDIEIPFAAGALVTAQRVFIKNTSGAATAGNTVAEIGVSASGRYRPLGTGNVDHSRLRNIAIVGAFVSTKALASAATLGQGIVTIEYVHNA